MLCLAFLLEIMQWRSKRTDLNAAISITLYTSLLAALCAVATGWFLGEEGGYDADLLFWHKWLGIGMTSLLALTCILRWRRQLKSTLPLLFVTVLLLFGAGHYGGSITHGEDYLFASGTAASIEVENIQEAMAFETIIQPILKQKCMSCHNPAKAKGNLLMTTIEGLKAGGEKGKLLDFDFPMKSALLMRIHLPKSNKEHMPPSGKKQLTDDEILLLEWWLKNKACFDCKVADMQEQEPVADLLERYNHPKQSKLKTLPMLTAAQLTNLAEANIEAQQLSKDNPYLIVNLAGKKDLNKQTFRALRKVSDYIIELNMQNSNFSDQLADWLPYFTQLQKLQIQNTNISNNSLSSIASLHQLASLNLYGTAINDETIPTLEQLPALQRLYCWKTKISPAGIQQLQKTKPLLNIQYQIEDDLFGGATLNEPTVAFTNNLFDDSLHIRLGGAFKGASIFYTLDGSDPDSTSLLFKDSIHLTSSALLKAYCYKTGWKSSTIKERYFRKKGLPLKSVKLSTPPNDAYKGRGGQTLLDQTHGTDDITDGNWLGYQGKNLSLVAELDSAQELRQIALSALSSPGPWIFYPKGLKVSVSMDGKNFTPVGAATYAIEQEGNYRKRKYFEIDFEPKQVRFFKMDITAQGKNPDWHPNAGEPCWLFIDEVTAVR